MAKPNGSTPKYAPAMMIDVFHNQPSPQSSKALFTTTPPPKKHTYTQRTGSERSRKMYVKRNQTGTGLCQGRMQGVGRGGWHAHDNSTRAGAPSGAPTRRWPG